jgi:hypothetical protein
MTEGAKIEVEHKNNLLGTETKLSMPAECAEVVVKGAGKAFDKIVKVSQECCGDVTAFCSPARYLEFRKVKTQADIFNKIERAKAEKQIADLENNNELEFVSRDARHLFLQSLSNVACENIEDNLNLYEVLQLGVVEASKMKDENVNDEEIDPDWFEAWKAKAKKARKDNLKHLYAKLLAFEAANPGHFCLRTFEFLQSMTKTEEELIKKLLSVVADDNKIYVDDVNFDIGLNPEEIAELETMGITSKRNDFLGYTNDLSAKLGRCLSAGEYVCNIRNDSDSDKTCKCVCLLLTSVGRNLKMIFDDVKFDCEHFKRLAPFFERQGFRVEIIQNPDNSS